MKNLFACLLILITFESVAQINFTRDLNIPVSHSGSLSNPWGGGLNFPLFSSIDLNGDNVLDLFVYDRSNQRVLTYINNGIPGVNCWTYSPQYADQFPFLRGWAYIYDYNCDDKPDLFCDNYHNNGIAFYKNISQGNVLQFDTSDSTMQYFTGGSSHTNIQASGYLVPNFNDIDGDGDMDIIGEQGQCVGGYAYYRNYSMEHKGNCDSLNDFQIDHNVWGDFTLRSGNIYSIAAVGPTDSGLYNWNINCMLFHNTNETNNHYEIARRDDTAANIFTLDIDGDGDMDALIGDSQTNNSLLVTNGGDTAHAHMISQDTLFPKYDLPVHIHSWAAHAFIDADNDGVKDLIVSQSEWSNNHSILLYKNIGTNSVPNFHFVTRNFLQDQMIDVGESATPVLIDIDGDGLKDMVIGNKYFTVNDTDFTTGLTLYRNTGTISSPSFEYVTDDYAGLISLLLPGQIFPAFGDLDNDNDIDMLIGLDNGKLVCFINTAGPGNTPVYASPVFNYSNIDVGQGAAPQLVDLNRDGFLDLIIGQKNGIIKYYQNTTNLSVPFSSVATDDSLGSILLQTPGYTDGYTVPFAFLQGGDFRMLVSCMAGDVYLYGNIDGNLSGAFTKIDTVITCSGGARLGNNISVSGGDLNGDTLTDIVFGYYGGGVQIFTQDNLLNVTPSVNLDDAIKINVNNNTVVVKSMLPGQCTLVDITGRSISTKNLYNGYAFFDVSSISSGVYMIRFVSGRNAMSRKFILAH